MVELGGYIGQLLKKLDDLGVADNTIVLFTTDNGAEVMTWPDGGSTPFQWPDRSEASQRPSQAGRGSLV
jgi:arylsulfatase A-like enzyme